MTISKAFNIHLFHRIETLWDFVNGIENSPWLAGLKILCKNSSEVWFGGNAYQLFALSFPSSKPLYTCLGPPVVTITFLMVKHLESYISINFWLRWPWFVLGREKKITSNLPNALSSNVAWFSGNGKVLWFPTIKNGSICYQYRFIKNDCMRK